MKVSEWTKGRAQVAAVAFWLAGTIGCGTDVAADRCDPGETQSCLCVDGNSGVQACAANAGGWDECACQAGVSDTRDPDTGGEAPDVDARSPSPDADALVDSDGGSFEPLDVQDTDTGDAPTGAVLGGALLDEGQDPLAGGVGSCGAPPTQSVRLNGVPWLSQVPPGNWTSTMNCGPASLLMTVGSMEGWSPTEADLRQLNDWMNQNVQGWSLNNYNGSGTSIRTLTDVGQRNFGVGLEASTAQSFEDVAAALRRGQPVIIGTETQGRNNAPSRVMTRGAPHFMVAVGIDEEHIYLLDPGRSQPGNGCGPDCAGRPWTLDSFCTTWNAMSRAVVTAATPALCGDGTCDPGESFSSCPGDCEPEECVGASSEDCGNCGTRTRSCDRDTAQWSGWSECRGAGECASGSSRTCGSGGTQFCSSMCAWGACDGETFACSGASSESCGDCGMRTRSCDSTTGQWRDWSVCGGEGVCGRGETRSCGSGGTQTCTATCGWGTCEGESFSCSGSSIDDCGDCGSRSRTCDTATGRWSSWGDCTGEGPCGAGDERSCGTAGTQTCSSSCRWNVCEECEQVCALASPSTRNPTSSEYDGGGARVMSLSGSVSECDTIRITVRKTDGSALGAGDYFLRVGTCQERGFVRDETTLFSERSSITFTTDFRRGGSETEKLFCVTKEDGGHDAWWWSNMLVVEMTETCD